ncbi:DNA/RNA nuclease SfsA [Anaerovorax odorimutans]|uniref:Sugar fermentation stimulation protein homolog n=1 Tax=Anaerovorax odorimutans TaxID=109327 RepID=A0ABT1RPT7_9FIRM|nr:DNA/RNA nuclease SfsA [Anaerovorax odorimutans]MCQ4637203.1 DNA/RNA nuclease SfsA [Anaerovorax odorimutans]
MEYLKICKGNFISRPNRFIASVNIEGREEKAHVKNTGRLKELLVPGAAVYLEDFQGRMGTRKMRYSLIGVEKNGAPVNIDSQAPNQVVKKALTGGNLQLPEMGKIVIVKGEQVYGDSRLDFYVEDESGKRGFIEVKGVTLEESGIARFPDAPTVRGVKHVEELIRAKREGYGAFLLFVIQMKGISCFMPNDRTHSAFGDALRKADKEGVKLMAYDCQVSPGSLRLSSPILVKL